MPKKKPDIREWTPDLISTKTVVSDRQRLSAASLGILGTISLHALVVSSVVLGPHAAKPKSPEIPDAASAHVNAASVSTEPLVLLQMPQVSITDVSLIDKLAWRAPLVSTALLPISSPGPLPIPDVEQEKATNDFNDGSEKDSSDATGQTAMFGRYTGQIDARIERAWRRPRTPTYGATQPVDTLPHASATNVTDSAFKCQVKIVQENTGKVEEVQILACNGTVAWRQSLVTAIFASSPLPAPPTPGAFSRSLTLMFTALPFDTATPVDDYEPESQARTAPIYP